MSPQHGLTRLGIDRRTILNSIAATGIGAAVAGTASGQRDCDLMVDKNDDDNYDTIQAAVDAADPGDTVCVTPGTYAEHVVINKELTLKQHNSTSPRPTVDAPDGEPYAIEILADDVTVRGFVVQGATSGDAEGLTAQDTTGVHLDNLVVKDNDDRGLTVGHSQDATLQNIKAIKNGNDGITIWQSHNCEVDNSYAADNGDNGIYTNGNDNTLKNSIAHDNGDQGIDMSNDHDVSGSTDHSWGGAKVMGCESYENDNGGIEIHDDEGTATVKNCHTHDNDIASDNDASGLILNETSSIEMAVGNDFEDGIAVNGVDVDPS